MEANKERAKVHRLLTEDSTSIGKTTSDGRLIYIPHGQLVKTPNIPQHLYFTTDEEIKEGDYIYDGLDKVGKTTKNSDFIWMNKVSTVRKIIASTDPKLTDCINFDEPCVSLTGLCKKKGCKKIAQPSQAFIKAYCEQGGIDEVDVEYVFVCSKCQIDKTPIKRCNASKCSSTDYIPLVDPIHNTITTHRIVEKMYSRDEMEINITNAMKWAYERGELGSSCKPYDWIKENL